MPIHAGGPVYIPHLFLCAKARILPQAPSLRVVSLRTEPNEANPNPDAPLLTMQSKELNLKEVNDAKLK